MNQSLISLVIPVYNEHENILPLYHDITRHLAHLSYEVIFVDDGSTDGSAEYIENISRTDQRVKAIFLIRNFGQTAALAAGFAQAKGNIIIPMDADGQNDPQDVPLLLQKMSEGYDIVSGWRKARQDPLLSRRVPSFLANTIISYVTGVKLHDFGCTLKAYHQPVLEKIKLYGEMHRFLPAWCAWRGAKIAEIEVHHKPRTQGKSKYGIGRTFKVVLDLMTTKFFSGYLTKPSYLFGGAGLGFYAIGFSSAVVAFYDKFGPNRWPALRIPFLMLAGFLSVMGTLLILMGLLAELMVRLYYELTSEKPYQIKNMINI